MRFMTSFISAAKSTSRWFWSVLQGRFDQVIRVWISSFAQNSLRVLDGELVKVWRARTRAKRLVEEYPHHRAGSLCL